MKDLLCFTDEGTTVVLNGKNIAMVACNPRDKTLVVHTADGAQLTFCISRNYDNICGRMKYLTD